MTDSMYRSRTASRFHRLGGPLGGVASGLAHTFGLSAGLVRAGLVVATIIFGAPVVAIYLALWLVVPIDRSVPTDQRPDPPPLSLLIILAIIFGLGAIFDFALGLLSLVVSLVPVTLMVAGAVFLFLVLRRSTRRSSATR